MAAPTVLKTEMEGATDGQSVSIEIPHDVFEEALESAPNHRIDQHTVMKVALSNMGSMRPMPRRAGEGAPPHRREICSCA
ncbi:MAG: hypothetical protein IPJ65_34645 [Archangiaceae bacterium]|nr:hypothetical protein [Archangiaceae bacterium]